MARLYTLSDINLISNVELKNWFKSGSVNGNGKFAIIDVRDSDYVGGHIKGSYHYPSGDFLSILPELRQRLYENKVDDVVFHCALSQSRGPSASLKFLRSFDEVTDHTQRKYFAGLNVWLLKGGFNKWQSKYGEDSSLTEDYNKDLWEFGAPL